VVFTHSSILNDRGVEAVMFETESAPAPISQIGADVREDIRTKKRKVPRLRMIFSLRYRSSSPRDDRSWVGRNARSLDYR
jgi:hypothetical protein